MTDLPIKPLSDIDVKSEASESDKILILDSDTDEARLASKEELKGDQGVQGNPGPAGASIVSASFSGDDIVFGKDDSTNAYKYKERVFIMKYNNKKQQFTPTELCNYRAVGNGDGVTLTMVLWLKSGERLLPGAELQQPNGLNGVYFCMSVTKLG